MDDLFSHNAQVIIREMSKWVSSPHAEVLMDEGLHSIFGLGKLYNKEFSPEKILEGFNIEKLKREYPGPFHLYSSQLPKRYPMSCLLDMVVEKIGQENEEEIMEEMKQVREKLKTENFRGELLQPLVSTTICVSQDKSIPNSKRYYGVSMSTSGSEVRQIMRLASCLSGHWHRDVADALMANFPEMNQELKLNRTIRLPKDVRCQVFNLLTLEEVDPCESCGDMFGFTTTARKEWPYGICAEVESLNKLLVNEKEVREEARPRPERTDEEADS